MLAHLRRRPLRVQRACQEFCVWHGVTSAAWGRGLEMITHDHDAVIEDMQQWQSRPLDSCYPVVLIDAIVLKIRDGQVRNRPVYVALGITVDGDRDVLGLWAGPSGGGEGAKQWMTMLTELRNRGVADVCIVC